MSVLKILGCIHDGWLLLSNFSEKINKDYLYAPLNPQVSFQLALTNISAAQKIIDEAANKNKPS